MGHQFHIYPGTPLLRRLKFRERPDCRNPRRAATGDFRRRGHDRIMVRGTFANVRIKNLMVPGTEGGVTKHMPDGTVMASYDAAMKYQTENVSLIVIAGHE